MFKQFIFVPIFIFLMQCENNSEIDCSAVSCYAETLFIKLIDTNSGENLLENGTYSDIDFEILDEKSNSVPFYLSSGTIGNYIGTTIPGTPSETLKYIFKIKNKTLFSTQITVEKTGEGNSCCGIQKEVKNIVVSGTENEIDISKNTITIFIE